METLFRFGFSILITCVILGKSFSKKSLSKSGCFAAFFVGVINSSANLCHFAALLAFFYVSNKATRYEQKEKHKFDHDAREGGQRNAVQVLCNGLVPTVFSAMYISDCGYGERPIDFVNYYKESWYSCAVLASLSCCCGDTLASELGPVLFNKSNKSAFHIILWKKVPKGTNGAISLIGTLASLFGGFVVGFAYYLTLEIVLYFSLNERDEIKTPQIPIILIGAFSGIFGSLLDSILGGYFQFSGIHKKSNVIVENPGHNIEHISGYNVLSNSQVNLISCFLTSVLVPYWAFEYYKYIQLH